MFEFQKGFESDNCSGVHPRLMEALSRVNRGHASGYGYDEVTAEADRTFNRLFGREVDVFYVFNGTGSNCTALAHLIRPHEAIVCSAPSHINSAETGAPERIAGGKIMALPSADGKVALDDLRTYLSGWLSEHAVTPRVLSLTQVTDNGYVYSCKELAALTRLAHEHGLYVHVDGARIANAVAASGRDLSEMVTETGIDVLSFGGTKNAFMFGEAIVCLNRELAPYFKHTRKSCGQLPSKMRYIAAQFHEALRDGLWLETARHANAMARYLYQKMDASLAFSAPIIPEANQLFAFVDPSISQALKEDYSYNDFGPLPGISRFVTSWDTEEGEIDAFIERAEYLLENLNK